MSKNVDFKRPDGGSASGYYAEPDTPNAPGIVVIQEWWGLNDQIKRVGKQWTDAGYRVLVPDLYHGDQALDEKEAEHKMNELDFEDAATQDVRGAIQYLKADSQRVGVIGFCMGGVLAVLSAMHNDETDVAVSWYGVPPDEAGDAKDIDIPIQMHFAKQDTFFPIEQAEAFEQKLKEAGVEHECYRYDAQHAFGNEEWDYYDEEASKTAWKRSLTFFEKYLKLA